MVKNIFPHLSTRPFGCGRVFLTSTAGRAFSQRYQIPHGREVPLFLLVMENAKHVGSMASKICNQLRGVENQQRQLADTSLLSMT